MRVKFSRPSQVAIRSPEPKTRSTFRKARKPSAAWISRIPLQSTSYMNCLSSRASADRWIYNDDNSAAFFHTPYGNVSRNPGYRGDNVNTVNLNLGKTIKFTERLSMRFEAQTFNLFNHRFLGVPDPFIDDLNLANGGTFANNFSNSSGGDYTNVTAAGLGRRRLNLGAKIIF